MRRLKIINNYYILIGKWILRILFSPIYAISVIGFLIYIGLGYFLIHIEDIEHRRWKWVNEE